MQPSGAPDEPAAADRPPVSLRRAVLAASLLTDLEATPRDAGVLLDGDVLVSWAELAESVRGGGPAHPDRPDWAPVARWLHSRAALTRLGPDGLAERARPVGLPVGHVLHPGPAWTRESVLGGALELGLGYVGLAADADPGVLQVDLLDDRALLAGGFDPAGLWPGALDYLERIGKVAAARLRPRGRGGELVLRPVGDAEVITLLGSRDFRAALAGADGTGMRAVAVPMRERGWLDLRAIDPAFAPAAAAATSPEQRGFPRPVLVTADEVSLMPASATAARLVLRDPAPDEPDLPDVLYR